MYIPCPNCENAVNANMGAVSDGDIREIECEVCGHRFKVIYRVEVYYANASSHANKEEKQWLSN